MKYKILIADTALELSDIVNNHVATEWQPIGGISVCNTGEAGTHYFQAVIMEGVTEGEEAER
jgi:hypothetical protein